MNAKDLSRKLTDEYSLTMSATFVPASRLPKGRAKMMNWTIEIKRGDFAFTVPYSQGIGHHPKWQQSFYGRMTNDQATEKRECFRSCESGRYAVRILPSFGAVKYADLPAPELADVVYSLLSDTSGELHDFKAWANEYGYSDDSIKARDAFEACRTELLNLQRMFTSAEIEALRELFQDY